MCPEATDHLQTHWRRITFIVLNPVTGINVPVYSLFWCCMEYEHTYLFSTFCVLWSLNEQRIFALVRTVSFWHLLDMNILCFLFVSLFILLWQIINQASDQSLVVRNGLFSCIRERVRWNSNSIRMCYLGLAEGYLALSVTTQFSGSVGT